ncbi:Calcium/calmodulin-dependent protein kinase [Fusarium oxysporum f. sp. cubense race 1]|uniref:Calcium/calmodulin-dependent protein kinase n=1 Tax=Fusarium oxysporum f. sp. cubense (strain race 1) TaxID=1229664 RepID=N4UGJ6_FUSC1|nr:Calcium/calmodulin-dependent protein kinase [Fusarium oxysporum f. sp. cubense race 1]
MSLYRQLNKCLIPCHEDAEFLPLSEISARVTEDNIKSEVPVRKRCFSNRSLPRTILKQARRIFSILNDPEPYVALKEVNNDEAFEKEKTNLELIQSLKHEHLIKLIATCQKGSICYFIFPWADGGDLRDFWKANDTIPRSKDLVVWSLRQILGIVSAINALHGKNTRHGDIKPQNILHFLKAHDDAVMDSRGRLILADVGVSKIHREITSMRQDPTNCQQSTVTYEAPEAQSDQREGKPRGRRYDMWSLGCMFLEFTVWLVFDYSTVRSFRKSRRTRDDPKDAFGSFFVQTSDNLIQIHSAVIEAIGHLRGHPLCSGDTALADLIQLIQDHLLQVDVQARTEAPELLKRLESIIHRAEQDGNYLYPRALIVGSKDVNYTLSSSGRKTSAKVGALAPVLSWLLSANDRKTYQGKGLGSWLVRCIREVLDEMPHLRRTMLLTGDWERSVPFYEKLLRMYVVEPKRGEGLAIMESKGTDHPS